MADRFAWLSPRLRPGGSTQALRIPSRDGHPALRVSHDTRPPSSARPLVYASPLQGCGGTFTPKRNAPLGAQPPSQKNSARKSGPPPAPAPPLVPESTIDRYHPPSLGEPP